MIYQYTAFDQLLLTVNACWISQLERRVNKVQLGWGRLLGCDYQSIWYVEFKDLDYKLAI